MNKKLLIIGLVYPEPNTTAAGSRMLQLIDYFKANDYEITFVTTASKSENSFDLRKLEIKTIEIKLNHSSFDLLLKELNPSFVVFDRFITEEQFGWKVQEICPDAIRILDTEDLHFLRQARALSYNQNTQNLTHINNDITKREVASIYRSDLTLVVSKYEEKLLKDHFKIDSSLFLYLPFLIDPLDQKTQSSLPGFEERKDFITMGNLKHKPNYDSIQWIKNDIWPLIHQALPKANFLVYGAYMNQEIIKLHNEQEGFIIKGWAKDKKEVFTKSRVCLAPLRFGAGLKGKVIDAMLFGTPNITTPIGAEGIKDTLPWSGFIENTAKEIAEKAILLYSNKDIWEKSQSIGFKTLNNSFDKDYFYAAFSERIAQLMTSISRHRKKNFIGSMLHHHTLQSTKYLSKWIEAKNSN